MVIILINDLFIINILYMFLYVFIYICCGLINLFLFLMLIVFKDIDFKGISLNRWREN